MAAIIIIISVFVVIIIIITQKDSSGLAPEILVFCQKRLTEESRYISTRKSKTVCFGVLISGQGFQKLW